MAGRSEKPASMADVALAAGVSPATVSRVINQPEIVSQKRRDRVTAAMLQLNFIPNRAARALATGASGNIAVLAANTTLYGYSTAIGGIEEAARDTGWATLITVVDADDERHVQNALSLVVGQGVAGVIGLSFDTVVTEALRRIPAVTPLVVIRTSSEPPIPGRSEVKIEDDIGALQATSHLLSLGHATVHYVGALSGRWQGWRHSLLAHGREIPEAHVLSWDTEAAYRAGVRLAGEGATAVMCHNDEVAVAVIAAYKDNGLSVPADAHVIGIDDHPLSHLIRPSLSTVRLDFRTAGQAAVRLLREAEGISQAVITPELVLRQSTGPR